MANGSDMEHSGGVVGNRQFKVSIDAEFVETFFPWLMDVFRKSTYNDLFRLGLYLLVAYASAIEKNHRFVEINEAGHALGYSSLSEFEALALLNKVRRERLGTEEQE